MILLLLKDKYFCLLSHDWYLKIKMCQHFIKVPGEWFPWSPWTSCTVTCGGGNRQRQRECDMNSYKELTAPCIGSNNQTTECHTFACLPLGEYMYLLYKSWLTLLISLNPE